MWAFVRLAAMVLRGAKIGSVASSLSTFAFQQTLGTIRPKQLAKSISRSVAQFKIEGLKQKLTNQIPFYNTTQKILKTNQAVKDYKQGLGVLKITGDLQALLSGDLKNTFNLRVVKNIRQKKVNFSSSLQFTIYKNEYGYEIPKKRGYQKKDRTEQLMKEEIKRRAEQRKLEKIAMTNEYLARQGFTKSVINRLNKAKKDSVYFEELGSNKRWNKKITQLNEQIMREKDYNLQLQREILAKGIKYKEFVNKFDPTKTEFVKKEVKKMLDKAYFDSQTSIENLRTKETKAYNINVIANQYNSYFRNMDSANLKAIDVWLNPKEYYSKRYTTKDIKSYMRGNKWTDTAEGKSRWISWAAWIPHYPNSSKGFFMVKIKNAKSSRNPRLLYSFGEFWGTPSITHQMFEEIFTGTDLGEKFWSSYFRKYGRKGKNK